MRRYPFSVIYEDNHLIIVNKKGGLLVQPDQTRDITLADYVKDYIKEKYEKPGDVFLGTVHRLDRPVSGIVVFARTSKALERMNKLFRERELQKVYWAVIGRKPEKKQDKLVHWLVKNEANNTVTSYDTPEKDAQKAELSYRYIGEVNKFHLLEIVPITGRSHQIRVQLASIGCPIRGDVKYGYKMPNLDQNINLHARRLYFEHPVRKEAIVCVAALPQEAFWEEFLPLDDEKIKDKNLEFRYEG
jgi:23S rRNA pseudouridine1911/1915/1917 synthase